MLAIDLGDATESLGLFVLKGLSRERCGLDIDVIIGAAPVFIKGRGTTQERSMSANHGCCLQSWSHIFEPFPSLTPDVRRSRAVSGASGPVVDVSIYDDHD